MIRRAKLAGALTTVVVLSLLCTANASALCRSLDASNEASFNATPISQTRYIWFNAFASFQNPTDGRVIQLWDQHATITSGDTTWTATLPASQVTFTSSVREPTATFTPNGVDGIYWDIKVPPGTKRVFIGGERIKLGTWKLPTTDGLPGDVAVSWHIGQLVSTAPDGLNSSTRMRWRWAAAVYRKFPLNSSFLDLYLADDGLFNIGTPLNYRQYVTGGARGGTTNFTGHYSAPTDFTCVEP